MTTQIKSARAAARAARPPAAAAAAASHIMLSPSQPAADDARRQLAPRRRRVAQVCTRLEKAADAGRLEARRERVQGLDDARRADEVGPEDEAAAVNRVGERGGGEAGWRCVYAMLLRANASEACCSPPVRMQCTV